MLPHDIVVNGEICSPGICVLLSRKRFCGSIVYLCQDIVSCQRNGFRHSGLCWHLANKTRKITNGQRQIVIICSKSGLRKVVYTLTLTDAGTNANNTKFASSEYFLGYGRNVNFKVLAVTFLSKFAA